MKIARDQDNVVVIVKGREVRLTNLRKIFWPDLRITKGDLLQYYADVAGALLPHIRNRAMVMKRYPHGAAGAFFFMKRAPTPRPPCIEICRIDGDARLRADRARPGAEAGVAVREGAGPGARRASSGAHDRRVSGRKASARPGARRLQPEPLGQHPRVRVLAAPAARGDGVDADNVGGSRTRRPAGGFHDQERSRARQAAGRFMEAAAAGARPLRSAEICLERDGGPVSRPVPT